MFKINDDVIHKSAGACVVADIVTRNFGNGDTTYYYLKPKFPAIMNKALEIYLPIEKEEMFIRKPLPKDAIMDLIKSIPEMEKIWFNDAKTRKQKFEEIYQSGDMKNLCKLVKLLYVDADFFAKPMSLTDKNFLNRVRHNIFDEFAVVLEISPTEVEKYVSKYLIS